MHYRIAFVGLGSMGTRHLKNVHTYLVSRGEGCTIDLYRSSFGKPIAEDLQPLVKNNYSYNETLPENRQYDIVFVTNPTSMHYETMRKFSHNTKSFFIEKPVFDRTQVNEEIFDMIKGIKSYVACPLRYNQVLQYVKNNIDVNEVLSARAISSSYLPDWRPGQDYRKTYSAKKELGGGVGIDLIHEWDYLTWLFETPEKLYALQVKISNLEINSNDVAIYIAKTKNRMIELHLDYVGREPIRMLQLFMTDDTVECDLINGTIRWLKSKKEKKFEIERNVFQMAEIAHFFEIINNRTENDSTPEHAYRILKIAKEES